MIIEKDLVNILVRSLEDYVHHAEKVVLIYPSSEVGEICIRSWLPLSRCLQWFCSSSLATVTPLRCNTLFKIEVCNTYNVTTKEHVPAWKAQSLSLLLDEWFQQWRGYVGKGCRYEKASAVLSVVGYLKDMRTFILISPPTMSRSSFVVLQLGWRGQINVRCTLWSKISQPDVWCRIRSSWSWKILRVLRL